MFVYLKLEIRDWSLVRQTFKQRLGYVNYNGNILFR